MTLAQAKVRAVQPESAPRPGEAPIVKRRINPAAVATFIACFVLVTAMGHVAQRARVAALAYELHLQQQRLAEVERINTYLHVEIERARSLERIEREAKTRLGMVAPVRTTWVVLDPAGDENAVEEAAEGGTGRGLAAALSGWFERVRSEIKVALPRMNR